MISIKRLSFRFRGSPRDALCDINLEIAPGEFVVITGPSGCGKSTLALAIGGYLFCQYDGQAAGTVTVAGMDVRQTPIYDVAEVVGLVQQNPEAQFCTLTVQDEVAFGLENRNLSRTKIRERIAWALEIVGAGHLVNRPLATLSGGEKQKVAIAAMMATKPQVLIFDEPTSNLDPTATAEIFKVIAHIREKAAITVLVIEHKMGYLLPFRPRLVAMEEGRVVYDGPAVEGWRADQSASRSISRSAGRKTGVTTLRHTAPGMPCAHRVQPVVKIEGMHVGYDGKSVLRDISLEIGRGEFVAVMGDNGSGKTTFLQSLLGLLKPSRGRAEVLGHDTRHTPISQLARQVGFVFQNPDHQLFAESVWQEATFALCNFDALDELARAGVEELLARCGLAERRKDPAYRLSYGEKRRLNLVSVLAYGPPVILLDEMLIGQDAENAALLLGLLRERVERGSTVIMVNHDPEITSRYASRLIFFNSGQIVVDAPTAQGFQQLASMGRYAYLPLI